MTPFIAGHWSNLQGCKPYSFYNYFGMVKLIYIDVLGLNIGELSSSQNLINGEKKKN